MCNVFQREDTMKWKMFCSFSLFACWNLADIRNSISCSQWFTHYLTIWWIYILLASNTWIAPSLRGDPPNPREGHSAALIGKRLFIFGGCGNIDGTEIFYDDVYVLNTGLSLRMYFIKVVNGRLHLASMVCASMENFFIMTCA